MKYLQSYENVKLEKHQKYKKGDYVLLDDKPEYGWTVYMYAKILKKRINNLHDVYYNISTIDKKSGLELILLDIYSDVVVRKLTPEEIDEYQILKNINKYNI